MTHIRFAVFTLVAAVSAPAAGVAQTTDEVTYYHTDAIGSVRMITGASQQVVARYDYLPFGESLPTNPNAPNPRGFGGKEIDTETGFDYFGARHYASGSGRFTTVDPALNIEEALVDPQRWNRYSYVRNNPYTYVDPDGRDPRTALRATVLAADVAAPFTGGASLTVALGATIALASYEVYDHRREIANAFVELGTATTSALRSALDSLTQASRRDPYAHPDGLPTLDRSGKVHGRPLPTYIPENWTREMLEDAIHNLRQSIQRRKNQLKDEGEDPGHRNRVREEEEFLRLIEKALSGS